MASQYRINVAMGPRLKEIAEQDAEERGMPASTLLRTLLIDYLKSSGKLTAADLKADAESAKEVKP